MKTREKIIHDKNVSKVYADRAKIYHKTSWTKSKNFMQTIINFVDLEKDDLALEVGIGTGLLAQEVKKRVKDVYGIDCSSAMLKQLPDTLNKANMINLKAEKMPYLDSVFDLVYWRSVIMHVINPQQIINEASRATKNHGRVFLVEPVELSTIARDFIFAGLNLKDDTHHFYFTDKDFYGRLKKAGYKKLEHIIHIEPLTYSSWMAGGAVNKTRQKRIWRYFKNAPEKFKKEFNIKFLKNDFTLDIKWIILKGEKVC